MNPWTAPRTIATGLGFPEGPVWLDGTLAFTEIKSQRVALTDADGVRTLARTGGGANGATLGPDGALWVANNGGLFVGPEGYWHAPDPIAGRIQRVDLHGSLTEPVPSFPGEGPHRPNDLCFGPDGLLYVTDPRNWDDLANLLPGHVWRVDPLTGDVGVLLDVPLFCNGIGFGPDDTLYVAQSVGRKVVAMDADAPDGLRDFANLPKGFPDGFAFAANGDLYVCGSVGDAICIFAPDGGLKEVIDMPEHSEPTNCCFGAGDLYVTLSGIGEIVAFELGLDGLPLYPARAAYPRRTDGTSRTSTGP